MQRVFLICNCCRNYTVLHFVFNLDVKTSQPGAFIDAAVKATTVVCSVLTSLKLPIDKFFLLALVFE